jgi:hypothetical protein
MPAKSAFLRQRRVMNRPPAAAGPSLRRPTGRVASPGRSVAGPGAVAAQPHKLRAAGCVADRVTMGQPRRHAGRPAPARHVQPPHPTVTAAVQSAPPAYLLRPRPQVEGTSPFRSAKARRSWRKGRCPRPSGSPLTVAGQPYPNRLVLESQYAAVPCTPPAVQTLHPRQRGVRSQGRLTASLATCRPRARRPIRPVVLLGPLARSAATGRAWR